VPGLRRRLSVSGANNFQRNFILTGSADPSVLDAVLSTARVRFISALVVIALLLGIVSEVISVTISYYTLRKTRCDAATSAIEALAKGMKPENLQRGELATDSYLDDCLASSKETKATKGFDINILTPERIKGRTLKEIKERLKTQPGWTQTLIDEWAPQLCTLYNGKDSPVCKE